MPRQYRQGKPVGVSKAYVLRDDWFNLGETERRDLSCTDGNYLGIIACNPSVDVAYAFDFVEEERRLVALQLACVPSIMEAGNKKGAAKRVLVKRSECKATLSESARQRQDY